MNLNIRISWWGILWFIGGSWAGYEAAYDGMDGPAEAVGYSIGATGTVLGSLWALIWIGRFIYRGVRKTFTKEEAA